MAPGEGVEALPLEVWAVLAGFLSLPDFAAAACGCARLRAAVWDSDDVWEALFRSRGTPGDTCSLVRHVLGRVHEVRSPDTPDVLAAAGALGCRARVDGHWRACYRHVVHRRASIPRVCAYHLIRPPNAREVYNGDAMAVRLTAGPPAELLIDVDGGSRCWRAVPTAPHRHDVLWFADGAPEGGLGAAANRRIGSVVLDDLLGERRSSCIFGWGASGSGQQEALRGQGGVAYGVAEAAFEASCVTGATVAVYAFLSNDVHDLLAPCIPKPQPLKVRCFRPDPGDSPPSWPPWVPGVPGASSLDVSDYAEWIAAVGRAETAYCMNVLMAGAAHRPAVLIRTHFHFRDEAGRASRATVDVYDVGGTERPPSNGHLVLGRHKPPQHVGLLHCVAALGMQRKHIPYRDSPLSMMMMPALHPESDYRVHCLGMSSPCSWRAEETLATAHFVSRVGLMNGGQTVLPPRGGVPMHIDPGAEAASTATTAS
eukprot:TRINITY_DN608_c0_g1_i1.p1 TRINITY_DN608_c0_g1~~TRINITY_DN608_c0_g1_i1.p1  ORF type:complete len:483 (+),score=49.33 TRINITY_DN608_c0_g1_i1:32-1480(+)